jgi:hypothetical protein
MSNLRSLIRRAALEVPEIRRLRERLLLAEAGAAEAAAARAAEAAAARAVETASAQIAALESRRTELEAECGTVTQQLLAAERERDLLAARLAGAEPVPALMARLDERIDALAHDTRAATDTVLQSTRAATDTVLQSTRAATDTVLQSTQATTDTVLQSTQAATDTLTRRTQIEADRVIARVAEAELRLETPHGTIHPGGSVALYLDLLEASLTGTLDEDGTISPWTTGYDRTVRALGRDWPATAATMIGTSRMRNLRLLVERALAEGIPGDLIETGVWRGGACIYMRGILAAHGDAMRRVFVADSFHGLPPPDPTTYPADTDDKHHTVAELAVPRTEVEAKFRRYGLLDERVVFLEGWFRDTLPAAPIDRLAVLRLDGDMYESTMQALDALYDKVSPGGLVMVDDYILKPCAQAVDEFRARHGIRAPLRDVDGAAMWWRVGEEPTPGIRG